MKKLTNLFFIVFFFLAFPISSVLADVGEVPAPGGVITSGDSTSSVEMTSEEVTFDIMDTSVIFADVSDYYAHVTAIFEMKNLTTEDVEMELFFPFPNSLWGGDTQDDMDITVTLNGEVLDYETGSYEFANDGYTQDLSSITFDAEFPADQTSELLVYYNTYLVNEPKSQYASFEYTMQTGSHWAGDIGSGIITFNFPVEISESMFREYPESFEIDGTSMVWEFDNLEPDDSDDIKITFLPESLVVTETLTDFLSMSSSASMIDRLAITDLGVPDGYAVENLFIVGYESNPFFLLSEGEENYKFWFDQFDEIDNPWVLYELEKDYEFTELALTLGHEELIYEESEPGSGVPNYDEESNTCLMWDRPKTALFTFSSDDGDETETVVTFEDKPCELQTVDLSGFSGSQVKMEVTSVYTDDFKSSNQHYVAIDNMSFELGDVVEIEDDDIDDSIVDSDESEDSTSNSDENNESDIVNSISDIVSENPATKYIVIALVLVSFLIVGLLVFLVILLKKNGKLGKSRKNEIAKNSSINPVKTGKPVDPVSSVVDSRNGSNS